MDRFASTTNEDIACLVQEKDSDNISNISPVFEEILCRSEEKGWDTYIIKCLLLPYTDGIP